MTPSVYPTRILADFLTRYPFMTETRGTGSPRPEEVDERMSTVHFARLPARGNLRAAWFFRSEEERRQFKRIYEGQLYTGGNR